MFSEAVHTLKQKYKPISFNKIFISNLLFVLMYMVNAFCFYTQSLAYRVVRNQIHDCYLPIKIAFPPIGFA